MSPLRMVRKKIGELLLERHIITPDQLVLALEEQKRKGGYVSQHLIALGLVSEKDIAVSLSTQYNFAYLPLDNYSIPDEVLNLIPLKWVKIYTMLPVDKIGDVLSVVMADPLNEGVIQMLKQLTKCEIRVFISTYSEIEKAIEKYFKGELQDLETHIVHPNDFAIIKNVSRFIQTKSYSGVERREYVRIKRDLDLYSYYQNLALKGKTRDISYGGVSFVSEQRECGGMSFVSDVFVPLNTSLACKIFLKPCQQDIDVVIDVLRVEQVVNAQAAQGDGLLKKRYEIAGVYEFITREDRAALLNFLKENIILGQGSVSVYSQDSQQPEARGE